ncbi:hypothetical protein PI126_g19037 [Phytophthora idaei]|nr:hypothetical protein PI126_g19037 [Phytophthora idaei]
MSCRLFIPSLVRLLCCGALSVAVVEGVRRQDRFVNTNQLALQQRASGLGLSVTKAQMLTFLSGEEFDADPEFLENGSNFWELLKHRWSCITDTDVLTMTSAVRAIYVRVLRLSCACSSLHGWDPTSDGGSSACGGGRNRGTSTT